MTGLRQRMAALAAVAVIGLLPLTALADPDKDESRHGRDRGDRWEDSWHGDRRDNDWHSDRREGRWRGECQGRDCDDRDRADYRDRNYRHDRRDVVDDARDACRRIARGRDWDDIDTDVRREGDDRVVIRVEGERDGDDRERRCVYSIRRDEARFEDQGS